MTRNELFVTIHTRLAQQRIRFTSTKGSRTLILAFDPGVSTGAALLKDDGSVVETKVLSSVEEVYKFCWKNAQRINVEVVIEKSPLSSSNYRSYIEEVENTITKWFPVTHWISPGQWKGHPCTRPTEDTKGLVIHERDAVNLGRYYRLLKRTKVEDVA